MKAVVFDMDGVLVDSEPLWREAERAVFGSVGIALTDEMCAETLGLRPADAVQHWFARHPWREPSPEAIATRLVTAVEALVAARGEALPGVYPTLRALRAAGLRLGLASSSPRRLIDAVLRRLDVGDYFPVVCSAADEARGKPDPAVYARACERLAVAPGEAVAFEDSPSGVRAAKTAGMSVIAIPAPEQRSLAAFDLADLKLASLAEFSLGMLDRLGHAAPGHLPPDVPESEGGDRSAR